MLNLLERKKNLKIKSKGTFDSSSNANMLGDVKYNAPSIKEWSNNNYSFNKANLKHLAFSKKISEKLIKSYFNLTPLFNLEKNKTTNKIRAKLISRHNRKVRKSLNRILVSKPEIKHLTSKVIFNVGIFNKEKESLLRKISLLEKSILSKSSGDFFNMLLNDNLTFSDNKCDTRFNIKTTNERKNYLQSLLIKKVKNSILSKNKSNKISDKKLIKFNKFSFKDFNNYRNKLNIFEEKLVFSILNKKSFIRNLFFFSFLKWVLYLFKIKVSLSNSNSAKWLIIKGNETNFFKLSKQISINDLKIMNNLLLSLVINATKFSQPIKLNLFFNYFKKQYFAKFIRRYLKKQISSFSQLYNLSSNNSKLDKFIPDLELILGKVFNKKVELNIIEMKYIHLDSSLLTEAISTKLKNKTSPLLRVMKRSLKLVKLPKVSSDFSQPTSSFLNKYKNKITSLSDFNLKNSETLSLKDNLELSLNNIFNSGKPNGSNDQVLKQKEILDLIKNKWIKGVKIEAKGRLTRRYTASRSVFKSKYKGNLRMIDYNLNNLKSNMLRGDLKLNMDYSFKSSFKRIGSFGIKGWISTN